MFVTCPPNKKFKFYSWQQCTFKALSADGFTDLDPETLSVVLDRDTLRMKESKLFGAVLRYNSMIFIST